MRIWVGLCLGGLLAASSPARGAELGEITVAQQYGVSFLPLMLMEHHGLVEKHAMTLGIKLKANWIKVAGPSVMNDGLLSGTMHIVSQGAPSLITLWDKTRDGIGVKGMSALTTYPLYLVSRNPEVR
ncbi:MAG: ABC transporter substrate-binding protein, partial [Xanthobacteraceae bacterium]